MAIKISEIQNLLNQLVNETLVEVSENDGTGSYTTKKFDLQNLINVKQYENFASLPSTGNSNVLYIVRDTNKLYYWDGLSYISFI